MNFVASAEDVLVHFWVPVTSLVTKVDTGLQHIAHAYIRHVVFPWVRPPYTPPINPLNLIDSGAPREACRYMCDVI